MLPFASSVIINLTKTVNVSNGIEKGISAISIFYAVTFADIVDF